MELLHLTPAHTVMVPPVMLHQLYSTSLSSDSISTVLLSHMDGVLGHRDKETLYVSVIAHRGGH